VQHNSSSYLLLTRGIILNHLDSARRRRRTREETTEEWPKWVHNHRHPPAKVISQLRSALPRTRWRNRHHQNIKWTSEQHQKRSNCCWVDWANWCPMCHEIKNSPNWRSSSMWLTISMTCNWHSSHILPPNHSRPLQLSPRLLPIDNHWPFSLRLLSIDVPPSSKKEKNKLWERHDSDKNDMIVSWRYDLLWDNLWDLKSLWLLLFVFVHKYVM